MKTVNSNFRGWARKNGVLVTGEGLTVSKDVLKVGLSEFRLPSTLAEIDEKYNINTSALVMAEKQAEAQLVLNDKDAVVGIVRPKFVFVQDDAMEQLQENLKGLGSLKTKTSNGDLIIEVELPKSENTDSVFGDAFSRKLQVIRNTTGGVAVSAAINRIICTNMSAIQERASRQLFTGAPDHEQLGTYIKYAQELNLKQYMEGLFSRDGVMLEASVADYKDMATCLSELVGKETAESYFPMGPIDEHYLSQGINVDKIAKSLLTGLPAGMSYYSCFNILTHGAKRAGELSFRDKIRVSSFISKRKLDRQAQIKGLNFKGAPKFDSHRLSVLMGDVA